MTTPGEPLVATAREGAVVTLTVNRPDARNALDGPTVDALTAAFDAIDNDKGVRCVILTGAGERAFVAGADIKAMANLDRAGARAFADRGHRMADLMEQLRVPIIAAVNGFALGAGLELALACDFIYAARTAKLGMPEVGLGVIPGFGGTQRLLRLAGRGAALELCLSGAQIDAARAFALGVVTRVVPTEQLDAEVDALADQLAASAPHALAGIMDAILLGGECGIDVGLDYESQAFAICAATADMREGTQAFLERRKPVFTGL